MIEQRSEEWFKQRLGHVTASRMSEALSKGTGVTRDKYKMQLISERLTGQSEKSFSNGYMEWGTQQEKFARMRYECDTDCIVDAAEFYTHPTIKWLGATPDGLLRDADGLIKGLIEIKCLKTENHLEFFLDESPKIPAKYIIQMQTQMWVTGADWCDFVSFDSRVIHDHRQIFISRVKRNNNIIEKMEIDLVKFLAEIEEIVQKLEKIK